MARSSVPGVKYKVTIRKDLAEKVELLLEDPKNPGQMGYGMLRQYMEKLIAKDMHERQAISAEALDQMLKEIGDNYES